MKRYPKGKEPKIVVIGAGFAGLEVVRQLANENVRVTVIDKSNHHLFQPLLYQVATAGLTPSDICEPIRSIVGKQKNTRVIMGTAVGVDPVNQKVLIEDIVKSREIPYDYLIIATGLRHSYFGNNWEQFAPGLKTIEDATNIRQRILLAFEAAELECMKTQRMEYLTFVVVGGGPTGVEMAGAIAELAKRALTKDFRFIKPEQARIILIEAGDRLLPVYSAELSAKAEAELIKLGVEIIKGHPVQDIDDAGVVVNGERINAKTVVWAAGVQAEKSAEWIQAETDRAGRIKVDAYLNPVNGKDNIYVIGDVALALQNGKPLPGLAPVAMQQGKYTAKTIIKRLNNKAIKPFHYKDVGSLATVGRSFAVAEIGRFKLSGLFIWLLWVVIHIWKIVDFQDRVLVMIKWIWAYFTYARGARIITESAVEKRRKSSAEK